MRSLFGHIGLATIAMLWAPCALAQEPISPTVEELRTLVSERKLSEAEAGARELLERTEAQSGADSPAVAEVLDVLLESLWRGGKAADPETLSVGERSLEIKQRTLGDEDAGVGMTMHHLAVVHFFRGEYGAARDLWDRAIEIRRNALGPEHPDVAESMNGLANVLQTLGDYEAAQLLYEQTLTIREAAYGPDDPRVAQTLNNLASLLIATGHYVEALPRAERSLNIKEETVGPEHPQVAATLTSLAEIYSKTGDDERARQLFERAVSVFEKAFGPEHPYVGLGLNNLAEQLRSEGDLAEAQRLFERALVIWEGAYGPEHPRVAICLNNLATLQQANGNLAEAKALHERGVRIREAALGPDHPDLAETTHNLGNLLLEMGDYPKARSIFERTVAIREKALGPDHPSVGASRLGLAKVHGLTGEPALALEMALGSERIARDHLRLTGRSLAEEHALRYAAARETGLDLALTVATERSQGTTTQPVLDALIRSRAVVLDEMAARNRSVSGSADPRIGELAGTLAAARARLANLTVRGLGDLDPETYRVIVSEARDEKERAERALGAASVDFAQEQERKRIGADDVIAQLPRGSALVSYALYDRFDLAPAAEGAPAVETAAAAPRDAVPSYVALVVRRDRNELAAIRIGAAEELDALVDRWKREAARGALSIRRTPEESEQAYRKVAGELRRRIWDPLEPLLADVDRVFLVPDGSLNLVSFVAFPVGEDTYLIEKGPLLHYLSAERDLVPSSEPGRPGEGLFALGGPDYDETSMFAALSADVEPAAERREGKPGSSGTRAAGCTSFASLSFDPLPAATREAGEITALWNDATKTEGDDSTAAYLSGSDATETAFKKSVVGRRILHIATHGFFLGGDCVGTGRSTRGFSVVEETPEEVPTGVSPLLLSGLALAGANHRDAAGPDEDDGVLTAEEIAGLDLAGVEWAVLSACDTGVGEIQAGEGVFGLRRAIQVAGVRTLIMSLWPVDDEATRVWMNALYRSRLIEKRDSAASVRQAGLSVLRKQRKAGESTHPFYWAAFVAAGDWR